MTCIVGFDSSGRKISKKFLLCQRPYGFTVRLLRYGKVALVLPKEWDWEHSIESGFWKWRMRRVQD